MSKPYTPLPTQNPPPREVPEEVAFAIKMLKESRHCEDLLTKALMETNDVNTQMFLLGTMVGCIQMALEELTKLTKK